MKTILCPTDFSECAKNAIHYAHELAAVENAKVILFHVCEIPIVPGAIPYYGTNFDELTTCHVTEEDLEGIWSELVQNKKPLKVQYKGIVKNGFLVEELTKVVKEEQVDLIVLGTEGSSGLKKVLVGTNAASIIEKVDCPVLVIPSGTSYTPIKELVFATDLQSYDEDELIYTVELAKIYGAHISMLHINDHIFEEEIRLLARMDSLRERSNYDQISLNIRKASNTQEAIYSFAKRINADIIVMSTHNRSFLEKIFSKSMTEEIAFRTYIPLLALHKELELETGV